MNKSELIDAVAASADLPKASAGRAIDAIIDAITASLQKDDPVVLVGFGTFATNLISSIFVMECLYSYHYMPSLIGIVTPPPTATGRVPLAQAVQAGRHAHSCDGRSAASQ